MGTIKELHTGATYNTDSAKTLPEGMYLGLFHGRKAVDEELNDWGSEGPVLGPIKYAHTTYSSHFRVCSTHEDEAHDLEIVEGMIHYDEKYYGDWTVFYHKPLAN